MFGPAAIGEVLHIQYNFRLGIRSFRVLLLGHHGGGVRLRRMMTQRIYNSSLLAAAVDADPCDVVSIHHGALRDVCIFSQQCDHSIMLTA